MALGAADCGLWKYFRAALRHASVLGREYATTARNSARALIEAKFVDNDGTGQNDFMELFERCGGELSEMAPTHNFINNLIFVDASMACTLCGRENTADATPYRYLQLYCARESLQFTAPLEVCAILPCSESLQQVHRSWHRLVK